MRPIRRAAPFLIALLPIVPAPAAAHPHVFIDAAARFVIDAEGRLAAVEIEHLYDPLVSLFVLNDLGVDPFAPLSAEDAARLAAEQRAMLTDADGFAALAIGPEGRPLGPPEAVEVDIQDERMRVRFAAPVVEPEALDGLPATLALFDPVHFIAFELVGPVTVGGRAGCAAEALEWAPTDGLLALQSALMALALDEAPEDPTVGRLFAAEARLRCE